MLTLDTAKRPNPVTSARSPKYSPGPMRCLITTWLGLGLGLGLGLACGDDREEERGREEGL